MANPNSVFYPSLVCNFRFRFEQAFIGGAEPTAMSVAQLAQNPPSQGNGGPNPQALSGSADQFSQIFGISPRSCSVELPGYRQFGKFEMELDFKDFPIDPRAVRALGVEVYLDALLEGDFGTGMQTQLQPGIVAQPRPSIVTPTPDNQLIVGVADTVTVEHRANGSYVHIEGRDLRGVLSDLKLRPEMFLGATGTANAPLDLTQPIDGVVQQIVNRVPFLATNPTILVRTFTTDDWPNGQVPSPGVQGNLTRVQLGADGTKPNVNPSADANSMSFWDLITQYCFLVGAIPFFYGRELRIRPARSLFDIQRQEDNVDPGTLKTPFENNTVRQVEVVNGAQTSKVTLKHRVMVYGSNIQNLKFERKLGGVKVPVVECVSVDTSNQQRGHANRLIVAQWPDDTGVGSSSKVQGAKVTTVAPSGAVSQTEVIRVPVPGVKDKKQLQTIARHLREEIGRQEIGGSCSTKDLASFGGGNADPDLLRLRPGDPVEFKISVNGPTTNPPFAAELMRQVGAGGAAALAQLIAQRIGDINIAKVMANTLTGSVTKFQDIFRVGNVKYTWGKDEGVGIDFDFQNYIEARYDVEGSQNNANQPGVGIQGIPNGALGS